MRDLVCLGLLYEIVLQIKIVRQTEIIQWKQRSRQRETAKQTFATLKKKD